MLENFKGYLRFKKTD